MNYKPIVSCIFWVCWAFIFYTYLLFPLILAFLARIRSNSVQPVASTDFNADNLPKVSMVVAAYNEEAVLEAKLANTWNIDYPAERLEALIGSDGSSDRTSAILQACPDSRLRSFVFTERRGKISVLNDLMAQTTGDIVVMSDANTQFSPLAVRYLIAHFDDPMVGCVSGELSLENSGGVSGEGLYWRYESWIKRSEGKLGFLIGCNGGIFAMRRSLYDQLPSSTIIEDFVLTLRVLEKGYRVHFEPRAQAIEPPCASARAEMVRKIRIGAGGWQALGLTFALLHPRHGHCAFAFWGHKVFRWLVPFAFGIAFLANCILSNYSLYRGLLICQIVTSAFALWAYHAPSGAPVPRWARPFSYFYLMNYALFCGFLRFVFGTQRVTWDKAVSAPPKT